MEKSDQAAIKFRIPVQDPIAIKGQGKEFCQGRRMALEDLFLRHLPAILTNAPSGTTENPNWVVLVRAIVTGET